MDQWTAWTVHGVHEVHQPDDADLMIAGRDAADMLIGLLFRDGSAPFDGVHSLHRRR
jgi:hypothetical protein